MLIQSRDTCVSLLTGLEQIRLYERLLTIAEAASLETEQTVISQHLGKLHRKSFPPTQETVIAAGAPRSEHYEKQLTSLAYYTKAHQQLAAMPPEKKRENDTLQQENTHAMNQLEIESQYDLMSFVYIEQLKVYRKEHPEKVMNVLRRIDRFASRLQKQRLFPHAHCLYQLVLKELSTQQNFYDTTCLKDIDESFLLEGLWALQEGCLGRTVTSLEPVEIPYFWSENLTVLQQLRQDKKSGVDKLMSCIDELRYTPAIIEQVERLQRDITQTMKDFFTRLFKQAESLVGDPPCDYSLMALGSIARGDMTPFSDLESVLLVEKPCTKGSLETLYFESLWKLIAFQIKALGESYDEKPGLHIDGECHPLLLPELMTTPEKLIEAYGLKAITTDEHTEGTLALTLLNSTVVYSHEDEKKSDTLWERYTQLLNKELETTLPSDDTTTPPTVLRHQKANEQLTATVEKFKTYLKTKPPLDPHAGISVKADLLAPLAYLLANLSFYHHLGTGNHTMILKLLVERNILEPRFAQHCRAALAELNLFRLHLHCQHNQAQNTFPEELPHHQHARLNHIWQGIITPLFEAASHLIQTKKPYHPIIDKLIHWQSPTLETTKDEESENPFHNVITYLFYTQSPDDPSVDFIEIYHRLPIDARSRFLQHLEQIKPWDLDDNLRQKTLITLAAQANPDGWQPRMDQEAQTWKQALQTLFEPAGSEASSSSGSFLGLHRTQTTPMPPPRSEGSAAEPVLVYWPTYIPFSQAYRTNAYRLHPSIYQQLFDPSGELKVKPNTQAGRHLVLKVEHRGHAFWLKFMPEQAGTEFAINRLERYLGGQGTPMTHIIKLTDLQHSHSMAIQISAHVPGLTLEACLTDAPNTIAQIDRTSFTQTLLRVLLTNPEDDKGDDYFLLPRYGSNAVQLIRIDNERAYYQPDAIQGRFKKSKQLQVKSMLYCLNHMLEPLDPDTLQAFLRLDPYALLERWLQELKREHGYYCALFSKEEVKRHFYTKQPGPSILGIPMADGLIKELLTRLDSMQHVIRLHHEHQQPVIGMHLLNVVQPQLAGYYEKAFSEHPIPQAPEDASPSEQARRIQKRFEMATQGLYEITAQGHHQSTYPTIKAVSQSLRLKTELTEQDVFAIVAGKSMSPLQALDTLQQLQKTQVNDVKDALLAEEKDSAIRFQALPVRHQLLVIHDITESVKRGLPLTPSQQTHCLKAFAGVPFHELSLTYFRDVVTDKSLLPILNGAHKHLLILDLTQCTGLSNIAVERIAEHCPHLETLKLRGIDNPESYLIERRNKFISLENVSFPWLKYLDLSACKQLTRIQIKAPLLETLIVRECPSLAAVETSSLVLSEARLEGNTSLTESGIEHLTLLPERLNRLALTNCEHVIHRVFREQYPQLGTALLSELPPGKFNTFSSAIQETLKKTSYLWQTLPLTTLATFANSVRSLCMTRRLCMKKVIQRLLKALGDERWLVRIAAASSLGQLGQPSPLIIDALLKTLGDEEPHLRNAAAVALGQLGQPSPLIIDALLTTLGDDNKYVRQSTASALGQLEQPSPHIIDSLLKALGDGEWNVKRAAASALGHLGQTSPQIIDTLLMTLRHEDWSLRQTAASAIAQLGQSSPHIIDPLLTALGDEDLDVRKTAASALGHLGQPSPHIIDALLKALGDEDSSVRKAAASALTQLGQPFPHIIDALLKALGDEDSSVRKAAASALGQLGQSSPQIIDIIDALLKALGDDAPDVRQAAVSALGQLGQPSPLIIDALLKALGDKDSIVRHAAASALGHLGQPSPHITDALLKAVGDGDWSVRYAAASAVGHLGQTSPPITDALLKAVGDGDWRLRQAAASALGKLGQTSPHVIDTLLAALEDGFYLTTRQAAASALGQLGQPSPRIIDALLKALGDHDWHVKHAAASALGQLGQASPQVIDALLKALRNKESDVRQGAASALEQSLSVLSLVKYLENLLKHLPIKPIASTTSQATLPLDKDHQPQHEKSESPSLGKGITVAYNQHGLMKPPSERHHSANQSSPASNAPSETHP